MFTCARLNLETLGAPPVMLKQISWVGQHAMCGGRAEAGALF